MCIITYIHQLSYEVQMPTCQKCSNEFPNRLKLDGKYRNLQRRKYCLECSPFGEHNTAKLNGEPIKSSTKDGMKICSKCGEDNQANFYNNKKTICKKCHNQYTLNKGQEKRHKAIDRLGGKCYICGYNKYYGSIDIHHLDPSVKDKNFACLRGWSWERIEKELQNCVALCRNCHSEVHGGVIDLDGA